MKFRNAVISLILIAIPIISNAQQYKTITLVEQRSYYLNGGARAMMGGKSRVAVKIDLPPNTRKWYYSFSTSPGEDGTKLLNLGIQVGAAMSTGGISAVAASSLEVPSGSSSADVLVLTSNYRDVFLNKDDANLRFFPDVSLQNSKQAVQSIEPNYGNSFYLGLRNPSSLSGINVNLEVVAIVEEINADNDKATLYCNLGWKAYERGELDKCVDLCKKALSYNPNHSTSKFNIAFVHLAQELDVALDEYVIAIADLKKDTNPRQTIIGALDDLKKLKEQKTEIKYLKDVEELLESEFQKW